MKSRFRTRRDMCHFVGKRGSLLTPPQAAEAWQALSRRIEELGEMDIPKFLDLIAAIRGATIIAKQPAPSRGPETETHVAAPIADRDHLPPALYQELVTIKNWLPRIGEARSLRAGCAKAAAAIGTITGNALYRRVRDFLRTRNELMLVDRRRASALWDQDCLCLPIALRELFRALTEKNGRRATKAHHELVLIWRTQHDGEGRRYEPADLGYETWPLATPRTGLPKGWSYGNLQRTLERRPE